MATSNPAPSAPAGTVVSEGITLPWVPYEPWVKKYVPEYMSQSVYDLGFDPYPNIRTIPGCDPDKWWMGWGDVILKCFTPERLRQLGIINLSPMPPVSQRFLIDQVAFQNAFDVRVDRPRPFGDNTGIHPLFASRNWFYTSPKDYEMIKPTLRIATEILKMDAVLDYLWTLGQPWFPTPGNAKTRQEYSALTATIFKFFPGKSTAQNRISTAEELVTWQGCVEFSWAYDIGVETDAMTLSQHALPGLRAKGSGSTILINERTRDLLDGSERVSNYNPTANDDSGVMRGHLHLAITLVHELAHAFKMATNDELRFEMISPYCGDQRVAENGFALELALLGNSNRTIHKNGENPNNSIMPFGCSSFRWPGGGDFEGSPYQSLASSSKHGIKHVTCYGLPMTWVHRFFTDEFWDNDVQRYGESALNMPMPFGVRQMQQGAGNFAPAESPRVRTRWSPGQGKVVEDPEIDSPDGLHPAVERGVLFPKRAWDHEGQELNVKTAKPLTKVEKKVAKTKRQIRNQKEKLSAKLDRFWEEVICCNW